MPQPKQRVMHLVRMEQHSNQLRIGGISCRPSPSGPLWHGDCGEASESRRQYRREVERSDRLRCCRIAADLRAPSLQTRRRESHSIIQDRRLRPLRSRDHRGVAAAKDRTFIGALRRGVARGTENFLSVIRARRRLSQLPVVSLAAAAARANLSLVLLLAGAMAANVAEVAGLRRQSPARQRSTAKRSLASNRNLRRRYAGRGTLLCADGSRPTIETNNGIAFTGSRIEEPRLSTATLAEFAGQYRSGELEATYDLSIERGALMLECNWNPPAKLTPIAPDEFDSGAYGILVFRRNGSGRISGLSVFTLNARNVGFERTRVP